MGWLEQGRWSPYIVGIGIGILSWIAFLFSNKPLGCSTAYAKTGGMIEKVFRGKKVEKKPYYQKFAPVIDWEWMLVLGIFIGAFFSSKISGQFQLQWVPLLWANTFGDSAAVRWISAFIGGIFIGFGARWAGGCTSGHGLSGTLQLTVSSFLATFSFFISGMVTAMIIFSM